MKSVLEAIRERRSIRSFSDVEIKREDLKILVEAAVLAPNAMNLQQWHFTVVTDKVMIQRMSDANKAGILQSDVEFLKSKVDEEGYHAFHHAPAVILITAKPGKFTEIDCGLAAGNIVLAACEMGLGSCIIASAEFLFAGDSELRQILQVPESYEHMLVVAVGYSADHPKEQERKMDVVSFID